MQLILETILVYLPAFPYSEDPWWNSWFFASIACSLMVSKKACNRYGLPVGLSFAWTLFSGIRIFGIKTAYAEFAGPTAVAFDNVALYSTFGFLAVGFVFVVADYLFIDRLEDLFAALCFTSSVLVIYQLISHQVPGGFLGNPSINGTMIAISYPLLCLKTEKNSYYSMSLKRAFSTQYVRVVWDFLCVILPIWAIFGSGSSIPVGAFACVALCSVLLMPGSLGLNLSIKNRIFVALIVLLIITLMATIFVPSLFFDSGRFVIWKMVADWSVQHNTLKEWLLGYGNGSYFMWGPAIQKETGVHVTEWWIWCHNDWLQVIFEQGIIGFGFYVWLFLDTLIGFHDHNKPYLTVALISFGVSSFFNFNVHLGSTAILGGLLMASMRYKNETQLRFNI